MTVYHGSYIEIARPNLSYSRSNVDFGQGFYTTPLFEQAKKWSEKFKAKQKTAVISIYSFDEAALEKCKVLKFESHADEWLDFILNCRTKKDQTDYDIVMGGVANDKVFNTVELFFDGLIDKQEALKRLRYEKPHFQIAFRTQSVLNEYLRFEGSEPL